MANDIRSELIDMREIYTVPLIGLLRSQAQTQNPMVSKSLTVVFYCFVSNYYFFHFYFRVSLLHPAPKIFPHIHTQRRSH